MKKFLAAVFMTLSLVLTGVAAAPVATAAEPVQVQTLHVAPEKRTIGGGIVKPFYAWLPPQYCYWSGLTQRNYYCYRYGCTYFERLAWGCYDGYVRIQTVYWA